MPGAVAALTWLAPESAPGFWTPEAGAAQKSGCSGRRESTQEGPAAVHTPACVAGAYLLSF